MTGLAGPANRGRESGPAAYAPPALPADEIFFHPEWLDLWRRCFQVAQPSGSGWVVAPRMGLRIFALPGGDVSDYKTVPAASDGTEPAALLGDAAWDVLRLDDVRADDPRLAAFVGAARSGGFAVRVLPSYVCPRLALDGTFEGFWRAKSKKSRYNVESAARRLAAALGPLRIDACMDAKELPAFFACAREMYARSQAHRLLTGQFLSDRGICFYDEWARVALAAGWLDFSILRAGATPVAFAFAFVYGRKYYYYVPGYDPAHAASSPGTILLVRLIERAFARGLREFDLLKGDEPYKLRWSSATHTLRTVLIGQPGMRGGLGVAAHRAFLAMKARARRSDRVRTVLRSISARPEMENR